MSLLSSLLLFSFPVLLMLSLLLVSLLLLWLLLSLKQPMRPVPPCSEAPDALADAHFMPRVLRKTCALEHHTLVRFDVRYQVAVPRVPVDGQLQTTGMKAQMERNGSVISPFASGLERPICAESALYHERGRSLVGKPQPIRK